MSWLPVLYAGGRFLPRIHKSALSQSAALLRQHAFPRRMKKLWDFSHARRQRFIIFCQLVIVKFKRFLLCALAHPNRRE
jgi:hypothetical protein